MRLGLSTLSRFHLARARERLWLRPLMSCVVSILAAFIAGLADVLAADAVLPQVSVATVESLLQIMSSSMLVIAVFAAGAMVAAYSAASSSATPRSLPLVMSDDVSQNALSTFIGAFIFSIVALVALLNGFYEAAGRFALFLLTLGVFAAVILSFVRWVDRIARLGRLGNTIDKVEDATASAMALHARQPALGAERTTTLSEGGFAVRADEVGYVQTIDMDALQDLAEELECTIAIAVLPGAFTTPDRLLASLSRTDPPDEEHCRDEVRDAFVIGKDRTFESDPRYGLIVLDEIARRALSPAINDPGTAIEVLGTLVRLLVGWSQACRENEDRDEVVYPRLQALPVDVADLFDDAFNGIAIDGAGSAVVAIRLQKALRSLAAVGDDAMRKSAITLARRALEQVHRTSSSDEMREAIAAAALPEAREGGRWSD